MAQKPWPVQLGSFALLPEYQYARAQQQQLQLQPVYVGAVPVQRRRSAGWSAPRGGWLERAARLQQAQAVYGPRAAPHALLHTISDQALHRYRAHHWQDKADPEQMAALTARVERSAERLSAAVAQLCGSPKAGEGGEDGDEGGGAPSSAAGGTASADAIAALEAIASVLEEQLQRTAPSQDGRGAGWA